MLSASCFLFTFFCRVQKLTVMAAPGAPGTEITVNYYEFITLYLACRVPKGEAVKKEELGANRFDNLCRDFATQQIQFEPAIGQIVGVFLPERGDRGMWVRGKVTECLQRAKGTEYTVLLIDYGQYTKTQRSNTHMVKLTENMKKVPPLSKRLGLYGVLPEGSLNQNTRLCLTDFFHRGPIYFTRKLSIENILFGDISVQQKSDGRLVSLTGYLLANRLVKKVDNFEHEARIFYRSCIDREPPPLVEESGIVPPTVEEEIKEIELPSSTRIKHDKLKKSYQAKDTGYSSSECLSDEFVRDDAVFVPAGFPAQHVKKGRNRGNVEEVKPIKTYFQLMIEEKGRKKEKRKNILTVSKEETTSTNQDVSKNGRKEIHIENLPANCNEKVKVQQDIEVDCEYRDVFKPRKISFGRVRSQGTKDSASSEETDRDVRARAFNINYKPKKEVLKNVVLKSETKVETINSDDNLSVNKHAQNKDGKREHLETSCSSVNSVNNPNLDLSNVSTINSVTDDSIVSNDSIISIADSDTSMLSKKQRISRKLKVGKAALEMVKDLAQEKDSVRYAEESVPGKSCGDDVHATGEIQSFAGHISSDIGVQRTNKSFKTSLTVSDELNNPNGSANGTNILLCTNELVGKICEQSNKSSHLLLESTDVNKITYQSCKGSAEEIAVNKSQTFTSPISNTKNNVLEDFNKPSKENPLNTCPDSGVAEGNSLKEKKKRIRERLKKSLEIDVLIGSETSQRDLSASCNQSVCSEESYNSFKSVEKPTLKSIITVPVDCKEKENLSNNCPESEIAECNSLKEKRKRIREKLKKSSELDVLIDSETSQRDLSASCSQSVCSEESYNNSKPVEKPTLESFITVPIEELENHEQYHDYIDVTESSTLLRCINMNTGVLIHSKDDRILRPAITLSDCCLDRNIVQTLECCGKREMNRIQRFALPTILARRNIIMVSARKSGKTCAYVTAISSMLLNVEFYLKLPPGNGPKALVITPCWKSGAAAVEEFKKLTPFNRVLHCYGGGAEIELKLDLLNGIDVLVTTPRCFLRLLTNGLTNLLRLCHLVMDDADVLFDKFKPEMLQLMVEVNNVEEKRECSKVDMELQVLLASCTWTPPLEELVTHILANPTICIGSQLEACVYAGIKPTAVFVENEKKNEKLVGILKELEGKHRIVVMCCNKADVEHVHRLLIDVGIKNVIAAHEDLSGIKISEVPNFWEQNICEEIWNESNSLPILIRSDEVLEDVPVTNANVLIHYNMPKTKKTFSLRFSCLLEKYRNIFKKESTSKNKPQVVILLDEKNDYEVPGVMEFMERLGTVLPDSIVEILEKLEKMKDKQRTCEPLCQDVKEFGQCWDIKSCPDRHFVCAELDHPDNVPRSGWVKILVQYVHDACHYSVRLLEHAEKKDEWKRLPTSLTTLPAKLNNYFATESNKRLHGYPEIGDVVALETSSGVFQRAVVLRIIENQKKEPYGVIVRLIDNGRYDSALVSCLWLLPEDLAAPPPSIVDIYLCGLRPKDLDTSWPPAPGVWVEEQLKQMRRNSPNGYLVGKINFALKGSLWLEPVEYLEFLPSMDTTVFLLNLRRDLLHTKNALENDNHVPALRRLCEEAGLDLPPEEEVKFKKPVQPLPQWAWLPQDRFEDVHIVVVQDPQAIFLQLSNFSDCLQKLVEDIQKYANAQKDSDRKKYLELGDICLGKSSDSDEWNRALIKNKPDKDTVELFFVDYGDINIVPWSHVKTISNQLITKLPFQAIECDLAGLKFLPPESNRNEWEDKVINMIYDLSRNEEEVAISLIVKVLYVEAKALYTEGKRYKVALANCNVDPPVIINLELEASNYAQMLDNENIVECFRIQNSKKESIKISECEDEVPSSSTPIRQSAIVPAVPTNALDIYDENDELKRAENNAKFEQFLKEFEEGDFDISIFHSIENDADVSDNTSEGSISSLPRSGGTLPRTSASQLQLPPPVEEDSVSYTSHTISSSKNSSTLSLNQETIQVVQAAVVTPASTVSSGASSASLQRITGIASNFKDLISPTFLGSENVSPFLKRVSHKTPPLSQTNWDDLDDNELDNTISEMNSNIDLKLEGSDEHNQIIEVNPAPNEIASEKSPCQKWVECVIPDSDSDLSLIAENSMVNESTVENADSETRTPLVEWYQDDNCIFLHIKLPALTEYEFSSDITSVHFSAVYGGLLYKVDLPELFGGHKSEKAQGTSKTCYFEIILEKLLKGKTKKWPRLTRRDEKLHWLKLNAEKACEDVEDEEDQDVKRLACSLPLWNENPADSTSVDSSDRSEFANSEMSM